MATAENQLARDSKRESKRDRRLYLRVSPRQRWEIAEAAEALAKDLSSFVLDAAILAAQRTLADRRVFRLEDAKWDEFARALERPIVPPSEKPRLEKLLREPTILEEG